MPQFDITRLFGFTKPKDLSRIKNLTGQKFVQLTIIGLLGVNKEQRATWLCLCDCGNLQVAAINSLMSGNTKSCGCRRSVISRGKAIVHGQSHTNLYYRWQKIISRCCNPSDPYYHNYGGRGIQISDAWYYSYTTFLTDVGLPPTLQHSLDRVDNNGHYEKSNVRWATRKEQGGNKRNNHNLTINGETHHIAEWCRLTQVPRSKVSVRLRLGWTPEEIFEFIPRRTSTRLSKNP